MALGQLQTKGSTEQTTDDKQYINDRVIHIEGYVFFCRQVLLSNLRIKKKVLLSLPSDTNKSTVSFYNILSVSYPGLTLLRPRTSSITQLICGFYKWYWLHTNGSACGNEGFTALTHCLSLSRTHALHKLSHGAKIWLCIFL